MDHGQVLEDVRYSATYAHAAAVRDSAPQFGRLTVGVRPREECQRSIGGADEIQRIIGHATDGVDVTNEVVVRQLHPLRLAGRAGRIDETREIVWGRCDDTGMLALGTLDGRGEGMGFAIGCVEAERIGQQGRVRQDLLRGPDEDVVRAAEQCLASRIVQYVRPILGKLGFVLLQSVFRINGKILRNAVRICTIETYHRYDGYIQGIRSRR